MRIAGNTRCSFRSSPARQNLIATFAISEIESSCRKHATKQFSNSNKNGLFDIRTPNFTPLISLQSYPFAQSQKACPLAPDHSANLRNCPRRLG
jgi:hypothetical protein